MDTFFMLLFVRQVAGVLHKLNLALYSLPLLTEVPDRSAHLNALKKLHYGYENTCLEFIIYKGNYNNHFSKPLLFFHCRM